MIPKRTLLLVAIVFAGLAPGQIFAIEVQDATVTLNAEDRVTIRRDYALTTDHRPDDRFTFTAVRRRPTSRASDLTWELEVRPRDLENWAPGITFDEYVETIYRCVDRFLADVPDAQVDDITFYITDDSEAWRDIKKKLTLMMKDESGVAVGFPEEKTEWLSALSAKSSPAITQVGRKLAKRLKRRFAIVGPTSDSPMLERKTHDDFRRTWGEVLKLPHLGIKMKSIAVSLGFESLTKIKR